jgi:hypothetical protein
LARYASAGTMMAVAKIAALREIRRDGKVIDESMTPEDVGKLGPPEKIVRIEWIYDQRSASLQHKGGMLAKVLPDRTGIAVLLHDGESRFAKNLKILNDDGSLRASSGPSLSIDGTAFSGEYGWFEPARTSPEKNLGIVFWRAADDILFQLDIDPATAKVMRAYRMQ